MGHNSDPSFGAFFAWRKKPTDVKREYDFSRAVRGKFFRKRAELHLPVYLGSETRKRLERIAKKTGTSHATYQSITPTS